MYKKVITLILVVICICSFTACSGKNNDSEQKKTDGNDKELVSDERTDTEDKEKVSGITTDTEEEAPSGGTASTEGETASDITENIENEGISSDEIMYESPLGYSLSYNPVKFTLTESEGVETFICNEIDMMVYIAVQKYSDMDVETVANGLVLQSGMDGVEIMNTSFGADDVEAKKVEIVMETGSVKQIQTFYAVALKEGTLLVEVLSFEGMPESIEQQLKEMLESFSLKKN